MIFIHHISDANFCESHTNCTWNDALVMSESVMIQTVMDKELNQNWKIVGKIKHYVFLWFNMFDIGCQSGSILKIVCSSTEELILCNLNKRILGLNSTSNILTITFTFQKRANRLIEGFGASYTTTEKPRVSPMLFTHEETGIGSRPIIDE